MPGHKDETLCRIFAEKLCRHFDCAVVCTGGFHVENISSGQFEAVLEGAQALCGELLAELTAFLPEKSKYFSKCFQKDTQTFADKNIPGFGLLCHNVDRANGAA